MLTGPKDIPDGGDGIERVQVRTRKMIVRMRLQLIQLI